MNPDKQQTYTIYTMRHPDGRVMSFKVYDTYVLVGEESKKVLIEDARKIWYNLAGQGFILSNKSVVPNMKTFHDYKKAKEAYMDQMNKFEVPDMQEMRMDVKKAYKKMYTDNWDRYALEA